MVKPILRYLKNYRNSSAPSPSNPLPPVGAIHELPLLVGGGGWGRAELLR